MQVTITITIAADVMDDIGFASLAIKVRRISNRRSTYNFICNEKTVNQLDKMVIIFSCYYPRHFYCTSVSIIV